MMPTNLPEESQRLDGPDYITVVVEWNDADDDDAPTMITNRPARRAVASNGSLATVLVALGAIALTTFGLRLLKHA